MGRRAKASTAAPAHNHALLGWGVFLGVLLGVCSPALGMSIVAAISLAGTCIVVFAVIWFLGSAQHTAR